MSLLVILLLVISFVQVGDVSVCDTAQQGQLLYMLVMVLFVMQDGKANTCAC